MCVGVDAAEKAGPDSPPGSASVWLGSFMPTVHHAVACDPYRSLRNENNYIKREPTGSASTRIRASVGTTVAQNPAPRNCSGHIDKRKHEDVGCVLRPKHRGTFRGFLYLNGGYISFPTVTLVAPSYPRAASSSRHEASHARCQLAHH